MRTTLDLPDTLFRKVKADAARRGITLKDWLDEAVRRRLNSDASPATDKPWMRHVGKLSKGDTAHLRRFVAEAEFSKIDPEDLS